ncbi:unnamed protein product, partial [marine sediment metagenome]
IKKTRDGKNMLLCTIEDGDGMYESVFFPDVYKKNSKIIMDQSAIIIEGRLCFKDGEISVIGRNVVSLIHFKKIKSRTRKDSVRNNLLTEVKSAWEI